MTVLQALCQQTHAVATPPQHLDAIALAPTKDKHMTAKGILKQRGLHRCRQAIEATTHIGCTGCQPDPGSRSEEHKSELQSLMRISYAVFCLKKKKKNNEDK